MSLGKNVPIPTSDAISRRARKGYAPGTDPLEGTLTDAWGDYLTARDQRIDKSTGRVATLDLRTETAPILATDLTDGTLTAGFYSISYCLSVKVASGVGAQLDVSFDWTDIYGITRTFTSAKLDPTVLSDWTSGVVPFTLENLSPVRYSTNYDGTQVYALRVIVSEIEA